MELDQTFLSSILPGISFLRGKKKGYFYKILHNVLGSSQTSFSPAHGPLFRSPALNDAACLKASHFMKISSILLSWQWWQFQTARASSVKKRKSLNVFDFLSSAIYLPTHSSSSCSGSVSFTKLLLDCALLSSSPQQLSLELHGVTHAHLYLHWLFNLFHVFTHRLKNTASGLEGMKKNGEKSSPQ